MPMNQRFIDNFCDEINSVKRLQDYAVRLLENW